MIEIQLKPHHKTLPVGTISAGAGDDSCGEAGDPGVEKVAGDSCTSAPRGGGGRGRRRTARDLTAGRTWTGSASPKDDGRDGDEQGSWTWTGSASPEDDGGDGRWSWTWTSSASQGSPAAAGNCGRTRGRWRVLVICGRWGSRVEAGIAGGRGDPGGRRGSRRALGTGTIVFPNWNFEYRLICYDFNLFGVFCKI